MPVATFVPVVRPSPGATKTPTLALNETQFGDGYVQASPKGLNHIKRTLGLKWDALSHNEVHQLELFFEGQGGYKPFRYAHFSDSVSRLWTCKEWSATYGTPGKFTATLVENFSLVS